MSEPRITLKLLRWQFAHIADEPNGDGGFQIYLRTLRDRAKPSGPEPGAVEIEFSKAEIGDLVFHIGYGASGSRGGYQNQLRKAFASPLARWLGL